MTFADELRNQRNKQEEIPTQRDRDDLKAILNVCRREAEANNNNGKNYVDGYIVYNDYDTNYWRIIPPDIEKSRYLQIAPDGYGVKRNNQQFAFLISGIKEGLAALGFSRISVTSKSLILCDINYSNGKFIGRGRDEVIHVYYRW